MAGSRLEYWTTLTRSELEKRVQVELRMNNLSFAQQQLLDAASERLRTWRQPRSMLRTTTSGRLHMQDDVPIGTENEEPEKQEPIPAPAKKVRAKKEKPEVAKRAAKAKGGKKKKAAGNGAKRAGRAPRIADDAKITKTGKDNPFRETSDSYGRVESVLKLSGQTAGTIRKKLGDDLKSSTLSNMKKLGLIHIG